ncbi:hypothetical protein [Desulfonatronum parangueonense]
MKHALHLNMLAEAREDLVHALAWLQRSHEQCTALRQKQELLAEDYDAFEALTSRFARVSDILLQKFFRALDVVELSSGGTLLDVLLRAEKRGLVESADDFLEIRELRNEISHEYAMDDLQELFWDVLDKTPYLIEAVTVATTYADKRYLATKDSGGWHRESL